MSRHENRATPRVESSTLYTDDEATGTRVGSDAWFAWLTSASTFYFRSPEGTFTAHHERRARGGVYWIAYRRHAGVLHRVHLGKPERLTRDRLHQVAAQLDLHVRPPFAGWSV